LQARLDELAGLAVAGNVRALVRVFIPLDISEEDAEFFASAGASSPLTVFPWCTGVPVLTRRILLPGCLLIVYQRTCPLCGRRMRPSITA
jgi:hypothetical protein